MSHLLIKGLIVAKSMSEDGKRTKIRLQETIKDKTQVVELSKFGQIEPGVGQKVEIVGRVRGWESKQGYLNTSLEIDEIYLAANQPDQPVYTAPSPALPMTQPAKVADEDIPF